MVPVSPMHYRLPHHPIPTMPPQNFFLLPWTFSAVQHPHPDPFLLLLPSIHFTSFKTQPLSIYRFLFCIYIFTQASDVPRCWWNCQGLSLQPFGKHAWNWHRAFFEVWLRIQNLNVNVLVQVDITEERSLTNLTVRTMHPAIGRPLNLNLISPLIWEIWRRKHFDQFSFFMQVMWPRRQSLCQLRETQSGGESASVSTPGYHVDYHLSNQCFSMLIATCETSASND